MNKLLVIIGILSILVCVGLSGCNYNLTNINTNDSTDINTNDLTNININDSTNTNRNDSKGIEIKLINNCNTELNVTLTIGGIAIATDEELATLSEINKTNEVHLEAGGEKFVYFDNLIMDFKNQNAISVFWSIYAESNLEHFIFIDLQTEDNATSPSILHHHTNLTFHQNGEVTEEG